MCYSADASPPIEPGNGGVAGRHDLTLTASDGNEFAAFQAETSTPDAPGVVILPDVRGLHHFYEELAVRFAENGCDAIAIDYFGRTAGVGKRDNDFQYSDHVPLTTLEGVTADTSAAVAHLRQANPDRPIYTLGFCFGGSNSWHQAAAGHGLAGVVGFYGNPKRPPIGPIERVSDFDCKVLALMAGEDHGIPVEVVEEFRSAMDRAGVENEVVVYPGAPHSFFDRAQEQYAEASADAWARVRRFIGIGSG